MPTYDYRCKDCGHSFETQQAFSDDPLTECPSCGGNLKKVFSAVGISFKGSGFYKTDSRSGSSKSSSTAAKSDSKSESSASSDSSSSSSSSDSKSSGSSDSSSSSSTSSSADTSAKSA